MNYITKGFGQIDWNGVKSVLIHSSWVAVVSVVFYILTVLAHHDFGAYQTLAVWLIGTVSAFLKKLCETYEIPVPSTN